MNDAASIVVSAGSAALIAPCLGVIWLVMVGVVAFGVVTERTRPTRVTSRGPRRFSSA